MTENKSRITYAPVHAYSNIHAERQFFRDGDTRIPAGIIIRTKEETTSPGGHRATAVVSYEVEFASWFRVNENTSRVFLAADYANASRAAIAARDYVAEYVDTHFPENKEAA